MNLAVRVPRLVKENGAVSSAGMEEAAEATAKFAKDLGNGSLDLILAMAETPGKDTTQEASELARAVTENSQILHDEVRRFLSLVA